MHDDNLILYYYGDGLTDAERREIEAALEKDELTQQRYDALRRDLESFTLQDEAPRPDMVARWHDSIDKAAALEHGRVQERKGFDMPSFAWGAVVTAALAVGVGLGVYFSGEDAATVIEPGNTVVDVTPSPVATEAFTRGLQVHFRQSRQDIGNLDEAAVAERQMLLMHIVQQNRLFAREAKENNAGDLARVLRAFEPILVRLAAEDITAEEAAKLQAKLAFELNVMLTKLERAPSEEANETAESI